MRIRALFFDVDGLLLDTEKVYGYFWRKAGREVGYTLDEELVLELRSCDPSIARSLIDGKCDKGAYDRIRAKRKELMGNYFLLHDPEIKSGVIEFLNELESSYSYIDRIVVTQSPQKDKAELLEKIGILDKFSNIISANDVKRGKPYPDIYQYASETIGYVPQECLAFEDSPNGVISAYKANVNVVMIPELSLPSETIKTMCIDVFENILESLPLIRELASKGE